MAPEIVKSTDGNVGGAVISAAAPPYAYVTFLAGDGDYLKGVVGLAKGLRKVGAAYPLVVAVLSDVPAEHRRVLVEQGCLLREIEPVVPPATTQIKYIRNYFILNYCKLRLWEFVEYEKMIYMDSDVQVFDNIDHLFDLPSGYFYGVADCICEMYGEPCPEKLRLPEVLGPEPPFYLNGGMFLFEPDLATYSRLLDALRATPPTPYAEQDFLNMFFRERMRALPPAYNLVVAMLWRHPDLATGVEEAKAVHFCVAGSKPWRYTGEGENMDREDMNRLVSKWWEIYNDESLDYGNTQRLGVVFTSSGGADIGKLGSRPEVVVHYRSASSAA